MLMLWLSMVCMIPFDLVRLDGNLVSDDRNRREPIMDRIIKTGKVLEHINLKNKQFFHQDIPCILKVKLLTTEV